ncbi:unnamed protein product [Medioppia subpectinata]|uniref:Protein kinase domain-containing protein n=1 Tax=Medioppia subpectinata TaxID=1979941 RepID=A0A7R9L710_9ACAR|nr:unnamed protein product [Medioppia subpectinata]CAG2115580.1 unnamed protein product [Medioppia subpectinata]
MDSLTLLDSYHMGLNQETKWEEIGDYEPPYIPELLPDWQKTTNRGMNYRDMYTELDSIGSGGFGHVFEVTDKYNGGKYAIKKCKLDVLNEKQKENILRETDNLIKLRSIYVI